MFSLVRGGGRFPLQALALALGVGLSCGSSAIAQLPDYGDGPDGRFRHSNVDYGTPGWAEDGVYPGLYGFSLRWHPGYGYGKYALGVGADGGYPFYGGPGYPHEPPHLNRCGPDAPYAYFGGPDDSLFGGANFYQGIGGLVVDKPVVGIGVPGEFGYVGENGERNAGADFGAFTGAIPYPETMFAPYASAASTTGSSGAEGAAKPVTPPPAVPRAPSAPSASRARTTTNVLTTIDGQNRTIQADRPVAPVSTGRPSFLHSVGNGPPPATR